MVEFIQPWSIHLPPMFIVYMIASRSWPFVAVTLIWCLWGKFSRTHITLSACDLQKPISCFNFQNHFLNFLTFWLTFLSKILDCPMSQRLGLLFFWKLMNAVTIWTTFGFKWRLIDVGLSWNWRMYAATMTSLSHLYLHTASCFLLAGKLNLRTTVCVCFCRFMFQSISGLAHLTMMQYGCWPLNILKWWKHIVCPTHVLTTNHSQPLR